MTEKEIIMYDSPEAAKKVTLTGWLSRDNKFFGKDEHLARHSGCSHTLCDCGKIMEKSWTKCADCRNTSARERFQALKFEEWDYSTPVFSWDGDEFLFDLEALEEFMEDNEMEEIDLLMAAPVYYCCIDGETVTNGEAHEDWEPSAELESKIKEFNEFIRTLPAHSYTPGKIRTTYKREPENTEE